MQTPDPVVAPKLRSLVRAIPAATDRAAIVALAKRINDVYNEKTCGDCGRPFYGSPRHATACSRPCKDRLRRVRLGAGTPERRLNQRDAQLQPRDSSVIPGTAVGTDLEHQPVRFVHRFAVRCVECGARSSCGCGAPRRLLPTWESGLRAATSAVEPEKFVDLAHRHRMFIPDRDGTRRFREVPGTWRPDSTLWILPESIYALRREVDDYHRHQQEQALREHQAAVDARLALIEEQNDRIEANTREILIRLGDERAAATEVEHFLSSVGDGCGVRVFEDA